MRPRRSSATAAVVALSTVFLSRQPRERDLLPPGAADETERLLSSSHPRALALVRTASRPGLRRVVGGTERLVLPGIQRHYAVRKRCIEDSVRGALASGVRQLVVLGAGLDTLALRIARDHPDVRCVELDHPATSTVKRAALAGDAPDNLLLVPHELGSGPWEECTGVECSAPTVVVLEGVTMYLTEEVVRSTLQSVSHLGPRSQVVWTFVHPDGRGRLRFHGAGRVVDSWLAHRGEPFTWGLPLDAVPDVLRPLGLEVQEIVTARQLRSRYLAARGISGPLAEGEALCLCRTRE